MVTLGAVWHHSCYYHTNKQGVTAPDRGASNAMHIGRTLPPAATPIGIREIISGVFGIFRGPKELDRFRSELKEHFGVKHCFLVSSGKAAFALILLALKELAPNRDEVLIPAYTCYSVPSSVVRAELKVRLCDLDPVQLDFDFTQLRSLLSDTPSAPSGKLLAVVPTHLFGIPSDVPRLRELVRDCGVAIVEDAAQAMGEERDGKKLGTLGDVSFFSLGRGKAASAVEGGIILTDREDIAEVLDRMVERLPGYGLRRLAGLIFSAIAIALLTHPLLFWIPRAMPFLKLGQTFFDPSFPILGMSSFQAGLTANWAERLALQRGARRSSTGRWAAIMEAKGNSGARTPDYQSLALLRFPIRVRDETRKGWLLRESETKGAGVMPVYPGPINRIPELQGKISNGAFPVAESCARELVTLPTHSYLAAGDVELISGLLSTVLSAGPTGRE